MCERESNKTEINISKQDGAKVMLNNGRPCHLVCAITHTEHSHWGSAEGCTPNI